MARKEEFEAGRADREKTHYKIDDETSIVNRVKLSSMNRISDTGVPISGDALARTRKRIKEDKDRQ